MGQIGDLSPQGSVALGILVGLISTSVQSLGLTLQRKSHILEEQKEYNEHRRPPYRRRRWQLGMTMFIVSNLAGSSIQITTLPLPVLSTLQASGLVFNTICATLILGEPFTRWSFGGTVLVCAGAILIAIFGAITEPAHNLDQLLALLGRRDFILWMIGTAIIVVAMTFGSKAMKYMNRWTTNSPQMRLSRGMAYGAVSGVLSAHCLLVAKSAVELLVRTIVDQHNQFNRWESWAILLVFLVLALTQLYYLHRGLKLCSTSILYPFVFCVYNIIAILDGLIYFHEISRLTLLHALLIAFGTLILLLGVLALSWRLNNDPVTRPAVSQSPLTPGLGFVDDETTGSSESETVAVSDEETVTTGKEISPAPSPYHLRTPSTSKNGVLHLPRTRRYTRGKGITEDIWDELEDEEPVSGNTSPYTPFSYRRRSSHGGTPVARRDFPSPGRATTPNIDEDDAEEGPTVPATESSPLIKRSATVHSYSYKDKRRRRSAPFSTPDQRERNRDRDRVRRRRSGSSSQDAMGGWWKMRWWNRGSGSKKRRKEGSGNDDNRGGSSSGSRDHNDSGNGAGNLV